MSPSGRPYQGIVVAHTHWDREWYATFEQYRIRLVRLIDRLLDLLETDPRFQYFTLDGQTIVLEDYLEIRPENEGRLRALVQSGRLLIGPWYVLPDEFLVSGEALLRNLMLGAKVGRAFGPVMSVGYVPDPFGHIAQLPQILAGFGIESFIFSRGLGDEGEMLGSEFVWQAPDGSGVLAVHQIGWDERKTGYLNASSLGYPTPWAPRIGPPDFALAVHQLVALATVLRRYARTPYLLFSNGCDHLEPQPELPALLERANREQELVEFRQGTFSQYVESVRAFVPELPRWQGELRRSRYAPLLSGVLSARIHLKQENARAQMLLERWAEPFSALAAEEGACYPAAFLWHAWRQLIQNHPHDSICGCSVDQVHVEMETRFARSEQVAEHCRAEALAFLAAAADTSWLPQGALPLAVFNPLGWPRSDLAELTLDLPADWAGAAGFEVIAPDGRRRACGVLDRRWHQPQQSSTDQPVEQVAIAIPVELPAFGYSVFGLLPVRSAGAAVSPQPLAIANDLYQIVAQPDGTIDVTHKPTGHVIRSALSLLDEADAGDEYTFAPLPGDVPLSSRYRKAVLRLVQCGPTVQTIEVELDRPLPAALDARRERRSDLLFECPIKMQVSLREGVDRVDVRVELQNASADHRLRLLLPTGIQAPRVAVAGHFGVVEREVSPAASAGWAEQPAATNHQGGFVDASDGRRGVALIADGLPEYEAIPGENGLTLALTLLRCVGWLSRDDIASRPGHAGPGLPAPGAQCAGRYNFRCAFQIHDGDWLAGETYRRALEHNVPPQATPIVVSPGDSRAARPLPPALSFLAVEGEGLVLSAVKRAEDSRWLVVRLYNARGDPVTGRLRFYRPVHEAALLRLDETVLATVEPDEDGSLAFEAPPARILTFGVRLGRRPE